jgi:hypothetical protein
MKVKSLIIFAAVALACLVGWTGYAQRNRAAATAWEYQVILDPATQSFATTGSLDKGVNEINALGAQGWELAGVNNSRAGVMLYLKRLK